MRKLICIFLALFILGGGMIYKEMEKRGIPRSEDGETEKKFREAIREQEGKDWGGN